MQRKSPGLVHKASRETLSQLGGLNCGRTRGWQFCTALEAAHEGPLCNSPCMSWALGSYWSFWGRRQWHPTPVLLPGKSHGRRSLEGCSPWGRWGSGTRLSDFTFTFHFHALEKEMTTHSSVLAWRIPGTGEPGGLPSMGSHRVRHAVAAAVAFEKRTGKQIRICKLVSIKYISLRKA